MHEWFFSVTDLLQKVLWLGLRVWKCRITGHEEVYTDILMEMRYALINLTYPEVTLNWRHPCLVPLVKENSISLFIGPSSESGNIKKLVGFSH